MTRTELASVDPEGLAIETCDEHVAGFFGPDGDDYDYFCDLPIDHDGPHRSSDLTPEPAESVVGMPSTEAGRYVWNEIQESIENGGGLHVNLEQVLAIEEQARLAVAPDERWRKSVHDLLATVTFLRSIVASGEAWGEKDEARMKGVYETARALLATPPDPVPSLDAAWRAAEAALPIEWHLSGVDHIKNGWRALAMHTNWRQPMLHGDGPTPQAALLALADKLAEPKPASPAVEGG